MERRKAIMAAGFAIVCAALGSTLRSSGESAAHANGPLGKRFECNNKLLKGTYGVQMQGTRPVPGGTGMETMIGVVTRVFDGAGHFTQLDNVKGSVAGFTPDRPGAGTYEVYANCSGVTRFEPGPGVLIEERFVLIDYGHEMRSITTTPPPNMVSTVAKRVGFL